MGSQKINRRHRGSYSLMYQEFSVIVNLHCINRMDEPEIFSGVNKFHQSRIWQWWTISWIFLNICQLQPRIKMDWDQLNWHGHSECGWCRCLTAEYLEYFPWWSNEGAPESLSSHTLNRFSLRFLQELRNVWADGTRVNTGLADTTQRQLKSIPIRKYMEKEKLHSHANWEITYKLEEYERKKAPTQNQNASSHYSFFRRL